MYIRECFSEDLSIIFRKGRMTLVHREIEISQGWRIGSFYMETTKTNADAFAAIAGHPAVSCVGWDMPEDMWHFKASECDYREGCTWKRDMQYVWGTVKEDVITMARRMSAALPGWKVFVGRSARWRYLFNEGQIEREWPEYPYLDNQPADWV